ncbi:alpha/beta hydrolase [Nitrospirillum amazonense]|uniref:alpha/beta fold hydrolase n=1 Tax=Nitrospirillum amazonense TaxID=28077 RepID=UPI002DD44416|nr:alpha/beta hydrolase [Nitrospirillum amazonense]MEC4592680.1 alpha/beta hydrolase [Nitrospirillum amazonense]
MKAIVGAAIGLGLAGLTVNARAQVIKDVPVVEAMADYVAPEGLVPVDGARRVHLRCLGQGSPTVVFTAGLGGWSATWAKVQPEVAKVTRACAWDRAGFGLSDADAKAPQIVGQTTDDLERALKVAGVKGPFVLVGHSAGAHEVLTFTDRHPRDVVGIVLVDPVRPHDLAREAGVGPKAAAADRAYLAGEAQRLRDCASGVESGRVKTGAPASPCFIYFPEIPEKTQSVLARLDADPARLRTQASAFEEYEPNGERVVKNDRTYGDLPLIVVSAGEPGLWAPEAKEEYPALQADWADSHKALAELSRRGERRVADGSGHLVQLNQPQAVIDAVLDVVRAVSK